MRRNHLLSFIVAMALGCSGTATGTTFYEDHFNYAAGEPLIGNSTANTWGKAGNASQIVSPVQVVAGSLAKAGLPGIAGNRVTLQLGSNHEKPYIGYTLPATTPPSVYSSFLLKVNDNFDTGSVTVAAFIALPGNNRSKVFVRGRREFPTATPLFIAIAYDTVTGTFNDVSRLWIEPVIGGAEPAATMTATNPGTENELRPEKWVMRQENASTGQSGSFEIDELRIADTWAEVAPPITSVDDHMMY